MFQSAGRIWGFWNIVTVRRSYGRYEFQSAGRIWGFWNRRLLIISAPKGVFQSAGRIWGFWNAVCLCRDWYGAWFQSAGRIWGFWNQIVQGQIDDYLPVSIRRADLGLLERTLRFRRSPTRDSRFNPPGGFGAFGTSQTRAGRPLGAVVSIRRADLGLLERGVSFSPPPVSQFQSAGRIWGFWNQAPRTG